MKVNKHSAKLRFPEFNQNWEVKKLGDISSKISDGIHSTPNYDEGGDYHFVNGNNLVNGKISINENTKRVNQDEFIKHKRPLNDNTILLSINGTIGNLAYYNKEKIVLGKSACYINLNVDIDKVYVFNSLQTLSVLKFFNAELTGSTIMNLSLTTIKNTEISMPSLSEQQKIATFLTSIDDKIQLLTKKKHLLEQYKKGVMQQIFNREIRFKDVDGNDYPEWEEKKLGEIVQFIRNGLNVNQETEKEGYKVTRIETISNRKIDILKVGYIKTEQDISDYKLKIGDLLFSNINSVTHIGKIAYVDMDYDLYHGMNLLNIRFEMSANYSYFYYCYLTSKKMKNHFERICNQAVSQASINQSDLKKVSIIQPSLPEQIKIADFICSIDKQIDFVNQQTDKVQQFKKGLLQQMFV